MAWHNARTTPPEQDGCYLVIYQSTSPVNRCKRWGGMGAREIGHYHKDQPGKWSERGTLTVAFWAHLPTFDAVWIEGLEGERGRWEMKGNLDATTE